MKTSGPILIIGCRGQLGSEFTAAFAPGSPVVGVDREEIDITNPTETLYFLRHLRPEILINCAAWNDVDGAEDRPLDALWCNASAVGTLSEAAREFNFTLVHFSSDFVFDGMGATPYTESDQPRPLSVYGMSKLLGEAPARLAPRHYVLRLSSLFGGYGRRGYVDRIVTLLEQRQQASVFIDRWVTPSYSPHVVRSTLSLLRASAPPGIYHCVSSACCTWYQLGLELCDQLGADNSLLRKIEFSSQSQRALRPRFCALANDKLASYVDRPPNWRAVLEEYLRRRSGDHQAPGPCGRTAEAP